MRQQQQQEDRENKGPGNRASRVALEEASSKTVGSKLRRRGAAVKTVSSDFPAQRSARRRLRPQSGVNRDSVRNAAKEVKERLDNNTSEPEEEEDAEEDCDPLIKRLKSSLTSRKTRKNRDEAAEDRLESDKQESEEVESSKEHANANGSVAEDEESESRERDREPEPPPANNVDRGGEGAPKSEEESTEKVEPDTDIGRAPSVESVVELVESSSQDGSVLERLSPLSSGAGVRHGLLLTDEREDQRDRHNESPVILAERLNKPPPVPGNPGIHQLQSYRHYASGSPVIHPHVGSPRHLVVGTSVTELHQQHQNNQQGGNARVVATVGDEASLMEVEAGAVGVAGVLGGVATAGIRGAAYGDSGSDSGVSSLRSAGSGDERSGSRSSALSAEETPAAVAAAAATPARVWHVQSVQHTSLLMAHSQQGPPAATGTASTTSVGYQSPAQPNHHHPVVGTEMLWRPPRYPPFTHGLLGPAQQSPEEMLERDRHERMLR